jgi:hypothetical protein
MYWSAVRVVTLLALATACTAGGRAMSEARRAAVAMAVDSATRSFEAAQRALDAERTVAHLAPEFYMYNDGVRIAYDSVVTSISNTMDSFRHHEPGFADLAVLVLGEDAALSSFTFNDSIVTVEGEILRFTGPTTLAWQRRGADWLVVYADADHYSVR